MATCTAVENLASVTLVQRHAVLVEFIDTVFVVFLIQNVGGILCDAFVASLGSSQEDRVFVVERGEDVGLVSAHDAVLAPAGLIRICISVGEYIGEDGKVQIRRGTFRLWRLYMDKQRKGHPASRYTLAR